MNEHKQYAQNPFKTGEIKQDPRIRAEKINNFNDFKNKNEKVIFRNTTNWNSNSNKTNKKIYGKGFVMMMEE